MTRDDRRDQKFAALVERDAALRRVAAPEGYELCRQIDARRLATDDGSLRAAMGEFDFDVFREFNDRRILGDL